MSQAEKSKNILPSDERSFSVWLVWAIVLLVGLAGWIVSSTQLEAFHGSWARTSNVSTRFESTASSLSAETVLAGLGNAGSLAQVRQLRSSLRDDLTLLERGGYMEPQDPHPVFALGGNARVPIKPLATQLAAFDQTLQPLLGAFDALNTAADAETNMPLVISQLRQTSQRMSQAPALSRSPWSAALQPVRVDLTRRELDSMQAVFTPSEGGKGLAKQWADIFALRAKDAQALTELAPRDGRLTPSERQLVQDLSTQATTLSKYAQTLLATWEVRLQARSALGGIRAANDLLRQNSTALVASVNNLGRETNAWNYIKWGSMAFSLLGLIGVLRALWVMGYDRWRARQDANKGELLARVVDRMTRDLRKIISLETNADKLFQPSDSPVFPLASLINHTLAQRAEGAMLLETHGQDLQRSLFDIDGTSAMVINRGLEMKRDVDRMGGQINAHAESMAQVCENLDQAVELCRRAIETSFKGGATMQEANWKMASLRENTQSTAKRVKRLGEGTQTITASSDLIKDMIRRVKVLALNLAVEAAGQGEQGKTFATLARELERLAQTAEQSVRDIDQQILSIQSDAKETVMSMEHGITDVVQMATLSTDSLATFKEQDRGLDKLRTALEHDLGRLQETTIGVHGEGGRAVQVGEELVTQEENLRAVVSRASEMTSALGNVKKWLLTQGRGL